MLATVICAAAMLATTVPISGSLEGPQMSAATPAITAISGRPRPNRPKTRTSRPPRRRCDTLAVVRRNGDVGAGRRAATTLARTDGMCKVRDGFVQGSCIVVVLVCIMVATLQLQARWLCWILRGSTRAKRYVLISCRVVLVYTTPRRCTQYNRGDNTRVTELCADLIDTNSRLNDRARRHPRRF